MSQDHPKPKVGPISTLSLSFFLSFFLSLSLSPTYLLQCPHWYFFTTVTSLTSFYQCPPLSRKKVTAISNCTLGPFFSPLYLFILFFSVSIFLSCYHMDNFFLTLENIKWSSGTLDEWNIVGTRKAVVGNFLLPLQ